MRATVRIGSLVLLLASIATILLVFRQYRYSTNALKSAYAKVVDNHDILDSAGNAFNALNDAALRAENYALTGETVYLEAFKDDQRTWQDESGTLAAIAEEGHLQSLAKDYIKSGKQAMEELAAVVALCDNSGREPALDRIRKSSSIAYLDQARKAQATLVAQVGAGVAGNSLALRRSLASIGRLAEFAGALFCIAFVGTILAFFGWRTPH